MVASKEASKEKVPVLKGEVKDVKINLAGWRAVTDAVKGRIVYELEGEQTLGQLDINCDAFSD